MNDAGCQVLQNLAVNIHLGPAFINAKLKSITSGKQTIYPIISSLVAMKSTDRENSPVAQVYCRASNMQQSYKDDEDTSDVASTSTGLSPGSRTSSSRDAPVFHASKTSHGSERLMCCDRESSIYSTGGQLIKDSHHAAKGSTNTIITQCTTPPDVLGLMPVHDGSVNTTQLYSEAETDEQKLVRNYAVTKQDANEKRRSIRLRKFRSTTSTVFESQSF